LRKNISDESNTSNFPRIEILYQYHCGSKRCPFPELNFDKASDQAQIDLRHGNSFLALATGDDGSFNASGDVSPTISCDSNTPSWCEMQAL
jgi:hypothetical protein